MKSLKQPPVGRMLVLTCLACAVMPLLLRALVGCDLRTLERLLFGVSAGQGGGFLGLLPGELVSRVVDGLSGTGENLFLLAVSWAQPAQVMAHLVDLQITWVNPATAVLGLSLLLWPLPVALMATVRHQAVHPTVRSLLVITAGTIGLASVLPQAGAMLIVALPLLPCFIVSSYRVMRSSTRQPWVAPLFLGAYLLTLAVDLTVGVWLISGA